jgi:hypothetical protein
VGRKGVRHSQIRNAFKLAICIECNAITIGILLDKFHSRSIRKSKVWRGAYNCPFRYENCASDLKH